MIGTPEARLAKRQAAALEAGRRHAGGGARHKAFATVHPETIRALCDARRERRTGMDRLLRDMLARLPPLKAGKPRKPRKPRPPRGPRFIGSPDFRALVERVRAIDPEAAAYMMTPHRMIDEDRTACDLGAWAVWSKTPQGNAYWVDIFLRLPAQPHEVPK